MFVFTQHPIETLVSLFDLKKKSDVFMVSCRQIYVHFISTITFIVYNQINLHFSPWLQASTITLYKTINVITLRPPVICELHTG